MAEDRLGIDVTSLNLPFFLKWEGGVGGVHCLTSLIFFIQKLFAKLDLL